MERRRSCVRPRSTSRAPLVHRRGSNAPPSRSETLRGLTVWTGSTRTTDWTTRWTRPWDRCRMRQRRGRRLRRRMKPLMRRSAFPRASTAAGRMTDHRPPSPGIWICPPRSTQTSTRVTASTLRRYPCSMTSRCPSRGRQPNQPRHGRPWGEYRCRFAARTRMTPLGPTMDWTTKL